MYIIYIYHFSGMNLYELAIQSVGNIIEDYDSDKLFPVLEFGARIYLSGELSHNFFVNGHSSNPYCELVTGVLAAYRSCIRNVHLYGPTHFDPTINHMASIANNFVDGSQYFILLIITDGIITDIEQTKSAIVDAAYLPISIIRVRVGGADFSEMDELDGDTIQVTDQQGRRASRDIVQFVPFRNFMNLSNITFILSKRGSSRDTRPIFGIYEKKEYNTSKVGQEAHKSAQKSTSRSKLLTQSGF